LFYLLAKQFNLAIQIIFWQFVIFWQCVWGVFGLRFKGFNELRFSFCFWAFLPLYIGRFSQLFLGRYCNCYVGILFQTESLYISFYYCGLRFK
jgi:hypothetical protein